MTDADDAASEYVRGPTYTRQDAATFEFKSGAPGYTGGGYPRWRSVEAGPHTPGDTKRETYVAVHRPAAVAWCYPDDWSIAEIFDDLAGKDVHHQLGMPSANIEGELEVVDHGDHSSLTQAQRRAYAEDKKRQAEREQQSLDTGPTCDCGDDATATVAGVEYCLDCAMDVASRTEQTIELS